MKLYSAILTLIVLTLSFSQAHAAEALVYKGPGSCEAECSESAALMAQMAGLTVRYVGPEETDPQIFDDAKVWIQPGGKSSIVAKTMNSKLKDLIRAFINRGGGYVGFCAGGFLATKMIADRGIEGLGILPGTNDLYVEEEVRTLELSTPQGPRHVYWEGGPFFNLSATDVAEPMSYYPNASIASVRAPYGAGRVYVTGLHPEAPQSWRDYYKIKDQDGLDYDMAIEMINWAIFKK